MSHISFLKLSKAVSAIAATVLIISWVAFGSIENSYITHPKIPSIAENMIVPHELKGKIVFISKKEQSVLNKLLLLSEISGAILIFVLIINKGDPFKNKR